MRRFTSTLLAIAMALPATTPGVALAAPAGLPTLLDNRIGSFSGTAGVVVQDGVTGNILYARNPDESVITASLYKLAVLVEAERRVDAGMLHYSDSIAIESEDITEDGSYELAGTTLSLDDALEQMITISDNGSALALERIFGAREINDTLTALRLEPFHLAEDASEDNVASPRAIATLFTLLAQRRLISAAASDRMLQRLEQQKINDRLPAALPAGTVIAHKTGNLGWATHDAGIIYGKAGEPVVVVATTWGSGEDEAVELIQDIGSLVYANALAAPTNVAYSVPQEVSAIAGRTIVQTIRLTNLGPTDWRLTDPDPYTLVWDMSNASGATVSRSRSPLPIWDVGVGKSINYPVVLEVPSAPGPYTVTFGLANHASGALAALGAPTATLALDVTPPPLVALGVGISPILHRGEASAAVVSLSPLDDLNAATPIAMGWRLIDRSNRAVAEGSVPVGVAAPDRAASYLVALVAPAVRGPFTLELFAVSDGRVASAVVRKSIEIDAPRTYPGEPAAGLFSRGAARP
jgi:beta-lactamase class A